MSTSSISCLALCIICLGHPSYAVNTAPKVTSEPPGNTPEAVYADKSTQEVATDRAMQSEKACANMATQEVPAEKDTEAADNEAAEPEAEEEEDIAGGEIAISMDDAPMPGTAMSRAMDVADTDVSSGMRRTLTIIRELEAVNAPPVGIFALMRNASGKDGMDRLKKWGKAGHIVANHSYSHHNLRKVSAEKFIKDIKKAHEHLKHLPNFKPWFRFPYLCEGNKSKRRAVVKALSSMNYREGYVTACNHDYRLNYLVLRAFKQGKRIDYDKVRDIYLETIWDGIVFSDKMSRKIIGRRVKQVLLLHANDMAALYIGDLIKFIRSKGWKVISIEEAYKDPIANVTVTNASMAQSGRLAVIAKDKGLLPKGTGITKLVPLQPSQDVTYIAQELKARKAFSAPPSKDTAPAA